MQGMSSLHQQQPQPQQQKSTTTAPHLQSIKQHVEDHLNQHNYETAVFLADKLLTMTKNIYKSTKSTEVLDCVFLLAKCFWRKGERRRACWLIRMQGNPNGLRERFMAAKCMEEVGDWNECLNILGVSDDEFSQFIVLANPSTPDYQMHVASLCFIRARCLEVLEKKQQAAFWYKETLLKDPSFVQAYDKLIDGNMLTHEDEEQLLKDIQFSACDEWLRNFYEIKLEKFEKQHHKQKEEKIALLTNEFNLMNNADVMTQIALLHFNKRNYQKVYNITNMIMEQDPYHLPLLPIHLLTLLFLKKKTELFYHAHKLSEDGSFGTKTAALANFASACYYFACGQWEQAKKFFAKSSSLDGRFLPALLGIGHSLSNSNDTELALACYRSTSRHFPNSPFPLLYMAMEYLKTNELHFAEPLVLSSLQKKSCVEGWNEFGVILLKKGDIAKSIDVFNQAVQMCPTGEYDNDIDASYEYIMYNLATAYRKARKYRNAYDLYLRCMKLNGEEPSIYGALGLTCHLSGSLHEAIEWYHKAMACTNDGIDSFVATMLAKCLNQLSEQSLEYVFGH